VPEKDFREFVFLKKLEWVSRGGPILPGEISFEIFGGSEEDVLARYLGAARKYDADPVIRVTGDNPLTSVECLGLSLDFFRRHLPDMGFLEGLPYGSGVEVIRPQALETALAESRPGHAREHVAPYIYQNPKRFRILSEKAPKEYWHSEIRTTVDTAEDFRRF